MSDFKKYYGGKQLWGSLIKAIPKKILGAFLFTGMMRRRDNTHYLFCTSTLGDSILAFSYLSAFKKQRHIDHVTVVCAKNYVHRLCEYYPDTIDSVICLEKWKLGAIREFVSTKIGEYYSGLYMDRVTFVFFTCNTHLRTLWDNPVIDYPMYAKAMMYKISLSAQPERPQVPAVDISGHINKYGLKKGQTVFINAVAKSVRCDVSELLTAAAADLTAKGYAVITLTANDRELPVPGTVALPCTLEEAFSLVEYGGTLIGLRSGFMDLMVFANSKIIAITDVDYGFNTVFDLEKFGVNPDCHTVIYDGNNETALQKILQLIDA